MVTVVKTHIPTTCIVHVVCVSYVDIAMFDGLCTTDFLVYCVTEIIIISLLKFSTLCSLSATVSYFLFVAFAMFLI